MIDMNFKLKPTNTSIVIMICLVVVIVGIGPLLTLWALNTLFPVLALQYSFVNWCAVVLLHAFFTTSIGKR